MGVFIKYRNGNCQKVTNMTKEKKNPCVRDILNVRGMSSV